MLAIGALQKVLPLSAVQVEAWDFSPVSRFVWIRSSIYHTFGLYFLKKFGYVPVPSLSSPLYLFLHLLSNKWGSGPNGVCRSA